MNLEQVAIIGAGPAGLAAALQLHRHGISLRIFERTDPGGLLWNANWVENYPGFPQGISGPDLAHIFIEQAQAGGVHITAENVQNLAWDNGAFQIETPNTVFRTRSVIVASGTKPRRFTDFSIAPDLTERIFYEIVPLLSYRDKYVVIVGAGDAAFDYALNLGKHNQVIIINRSEQVKCLPLLWERVNTCRNIDFRPNMAITQLIANPAGGMIVECSSPKGPLNIEADYLIGAIGRVPQLDFVSAALLENTSEFENKGILHFVGDVKNGIYRQTAIAIGDGIRAGMCLNQVLKETPDESDSPNRKRRYRPRLHP
ncbi:MAG: NAD(P)/FAD-dependent oxidoreductase [Anaerolineales bacterium]|nr:NAD(P)/FAD-dependent oxidoreductase [Anaerolineales bacterium]